jgi:hypothetical protein
MSRWLDDYKAVSHRTRWIGLIGAAAMLSSVALELSGIYFSVSVAEVPFQGDFADAVMKEVWMGVIVGAAFTARSFVLIVSRPERYSWTAFSGLFSFVIVVFYVLTMSPGYGPTTVCEHDRRCFTIYDIARTNWVALAGTGFLLLSFFRCLVTAAWVGSKQRYK